MIWRYVVLLSSIILFAACTQPSSHGWEMVGVASFEETVRTNTPQEFFVCNCSGVAVPETPSCGVEKFASYGGRVGANLGVGISISADVLRELGEVETWGHSVHLQPPFEQGHVKQYQVVYRRSVQQGQGLFVPDNSSGSVEPVTASFERERMCRVDYWVVNQMTCQEAYDLHNVSCARPSELSGESLTIPSPETPDPMSPQSIEEIGPIPTVPPPPSTPVAHYNPNLTHLGQPATGAVVSSWSADGRYVAISSQNRVLNVWDATNNRIVHSLTYNRDALVDTLSWSPDGRHWATGDLAGYVSVWDNQTGLRTKQWKAHNAAITSLTWSRDNLYLATGGADRMIYVWRAATAEKLQELHGHETAVAAIAWSPEGTHLVSSGFDPNLRVWDWRVESAPQLVTGHTNSIPVLAWSPDGLWLLSGDNDGQIGLWSWQESWLQLQGSPRPVDQYRILSLAWSRDSRLIAFSSLGQRTQVKTVDFSDVSTALQQVSVYSLSFSSDNGQLLVGDEQGNVYEWLFGD